MISCLTCLIMNYMILRLSLGLVKRGIKTLDHFLEYLNRAIEQLSGMNTNGDPLLEDNIKYLERIRDKNIDRKDVDVVMKEIARRKDMLEDYERAIRGKRDRM